MIKNNILKTVISSLLTLLPIPIWLLLGAVLPEELAIKLGISGEYSAALSVFVILPVVMLGIHLICLLVSDRFGMGEGQSEKVIGIVFWIVPAISLYTVLMLAFILLGYVDSPVALVMVLLGVVFAVIGNYLPKTTRNVTMGIKIRWTLANDENWSATHRLCGRLFVALGLVCFVSAFLPVVPAIIISTVMLLVSIIAPTVYSYRFYKKQISDGTATEEEYKAELSRVFKGKKGYLVAGIVVVAVLITFLPFLLFTGDVTVSLSDSAITVDSDFWSATTVEYSEIESVEYREEGIPGERINGVSSPRLLAGIFRNSELGLYTRYTYTAKAPTILITANGTKLVIAADTPEATAEIYTRLLAYVGE